MNMKMHLRLWSGNMLVVLALFFTVTLFAKTTPAVPELVNISFSPSGRIELNGDSTARKFSSVATIIDLKGTAKNGTSENKFGWTPNNVEMKLAIENLKSGDQTLDRHMYEALKAEKYPNIELKLTKFSFSKSSDSRNSVTASGTITIAGVTNPIELNADLVIDGENLRIKGRRMLLMSDFGIDPPTMMLGALRTRDEINLIFEITCLTNLK